MYNSPNTLCCILMCLQHCIGDQSTILGWLLTSILLYNTVTLRFSINLAKLPRNPIFPQHGQITWTSFVQKILHWGRMHKVIFPIETIHPSVYRSVPDQCPIYVQFFPIKLSRSLHIKQWKNTFQHIQVYSNGKEVGSNNDEEEDDDGYVEDSDRSNLIQGHHQRIPWCGYYLLFKYNPRLTQSNISYQACRNYWTTWHTFCPLSI